MKQTKTAIFGLLLTLLSTQAFAISVQIERCGGYKNDPRAYKECRAIYAKEEQAVKEDIKTYLCYKVGSITPVSIQLKGEGLNVQVRKGDLSPWETPDMKIIGNDRRLIIGDLDQKGDYVVEATCIRK